MVLVVRVEWPEFGDEQLQEMIVQQPDAIWRIDEFPNFVTYRRQIDSLKTVCVKNYMEPKPTAIVRHILTSSPDHSSSIRFSRCFENPKT